MKSVALLLAMLLPGCSMAQVCSVGGSFTPVAPASTLPTPPAGAITYTNMQIPGDGPTGSSWVVCSSATDPSGICGGGTNPDGSLATGSGSQTFGVSSPSLSGAAFSFTSNGANYNALASRKFACTIPAVGGTATTGTLTITVPTPTMSGSSITFTASAADTQYTVTSIQIYDGSGNIVFNSANTGPITPVSYTETGLSGQHNFVVKAFNNNGGQVASVSMSATFGTDCGSGKTLNIEDDLSVYVPTAALSGLLNLEFDPDYYDGTYESYVSLQCRGSNSEWYLWNMATNSWVQPSSGTYACNIISQPNMYHRVQLYATINPATHIYTYQTLIVDGVTVFQNLNQSYSAAAYTTSTPTLLVQQQIDNNPNATATTVYYDNDNYSLWFTQ